MRFSIVIPTRERADTLKYCLKTCLEQVDFTDYEIIISDNNSSSETKEVIDSFNSDRIKYFSTGKTLAMHDNFEFAISHASGEYIIVLGDDDGMLLKGLYNLDRIIQKTKYKAIAWNWIFYYWPEGVPPGVENIMYIPITCKVNVVNGRQCLREVASFTKSYAKLPMLYISGAIHRDLIEELRTKTGRVFGSTIPDVYSALCLGYLSDNFLFLDRPLSIAAISGKSNGNNHFYKKWNNEINKEFISLNNSSSFDFLSKVPNIRSMNAIVAGVFMQAKEKLFKNDVDLVIDQKLMISKFLEDLVVFDKEEWNNSIDSIRSTIKDDHEMIRWFDDLLLKGEPRIKNIHIKEVVNTGIINDLLVINGASFDCKSVYDVALFYNNFLESEIQIPENLRLIENGYQPFKKASLIKRSFRRLKLAGRVVIKGY